MIVDCNRNDFYFIELKGKNLTHALEQLEETIHHFKNLHSGKIHAIVVQSRTPKETVKVKNFIKKFRSKGIHLKTQNAIFEITL